MRRYKPNILVSSIIAGMLLVGCSQSDQIPLTEPDPRPIVLGYGYDIELFSSDQDSQDDTRASVVNVNTSATPTMPSTAGVFGAMEDYAFPIFTNQKFYHIDDQPYYDEFVAAGNDWSNISNDWPYAPIVNWTSSKRYNFYCYTPHTTYDGTSVEMLYNTFNSMQTFTLSKIPPFSNVAYTISKSVDLTDTAGQSFTGVVPFSMMHLSARICLRMKIGEKFHRIRNIKVKEITINDCGTDADYYKWEVDLTKDPVVPVLKTDGKYAPASEAATVKIIPIFNDAAGLELDDKDFEQFGSLYVMPQWIGSLQMNVIYDVYDKDGMLVRENQSISNPVAFYKTVEKGYYYDINIVVSPAYLYVLSDNDVVPDVVLDVNP